MAVMKIRKGHGRNFDVELPVEAYIAVASKLVTYLVIGAVWMQLTQIEVALPSVGDSSSTSAQQELSLTIKVDEKQIQIVASGGSLPPFPNLPDGEFDLPKLEEKLGEIKTKFQGQREVILAVQATIKYEKIVNLMDVCIRKGFDGIALSPYTPPWAAPAAAPAGK